MRMVMNDELGRYGRKWYSCTLRHYLGNSVEGFKTLSKDILLMGQ
jgi:hypothetical protein